MADAFCTAGKKALLDGVAGHTFKAALYTVLLDADTAAYTTTDEVPNGNGYTAGGQTLTVTTTGADGGIAWIDFNDVSWANATFTARCMLIYDSTDANRAYAVLDFGGNKTGQGGNFVYVFPPQGGATAVIGI